MTGPNPLQDPAFLAEAQRRGYAVPDQPQQSPSFAQDPAFLAEAQKRGYDVPASGPPTPTMGEVAKDVGMSALGGAKQAAIGTVSLGGAADLWNLGAQGANWASNKLNNAIPAFKAADQWAGFQPTDQVNIPQIPWGTQQANQGFNSLVGREEYQPKTLPGEYAGTMAGFGASALAGPGGASAAALRAGKGMLAGAVSEGAGQFAKKAGYGEAGQTIARLAGGLGGGAATGLGEVFSPNAGRMLRQRGIEPGLNTAPAEAAQASGAAQGMPLMGQESLNSPDLKQLAAVTAQRPGGMTPMARFYENRAEQAPLAVENAIASTVRGNADDPVAVAGQMRGAASGAMRQATNERTAQTSPFFRAAAQQDQAPAAEIGALRTNIRSQAPGLGAGAARNINEFGRALTERPSVLSAGTAPQTDYGVLSSEKKAFEARMPKYGRMPPPNAVAAEAQGTIGTGLGNLQDILTRNSENYAYGSARYEQFTRDVIDPLKAGPIGQIKDAKQASAISNILTNPSNSSSTTIRDAYSAMRDLTDPRNPGFRPGQVAFRNWAQYWLEDNLNRAQKVEGGVNTNANVAKDFMGNTAKGPAGVRNLNAVLDSVADANGVPPATLRQAWQRMGDTIARMQPEPKMSPGFLAGEMDQEAHRNLKTNVVRFDISKPFEILGEYLDPSGAKETYAQLARAFTDPNSVQALVRLAGTHGFGPRQQWQVRQLLSTSAATAPVGDQKAQ